MADEHARLKELLEFANMHLTATAQATTTIKALVTHAQVHIRQMENEVSEPSLTLKVAAALGYGGDAGEALRQRKKHLEVMHNMVVFLEIEHGVYTSAIFFLRMQRSQLNHFQKRLDDMIFAAEWERANLDDVDMSARIWLQTHLLSMAAELDEILNLYNEENKISKNMSEQLRKSSKMKMAALNQPHVGPVAFDDYNGDL